MVTHRNNNKGRKGSVKQKTKKSYETKRSKRKLSKKETENKQGEDVEKETKIKRIKYSDTGTEIKTERTKGKKIAEEETKPSTSAAARKKIQLQKIEESTKLENHKVTKNTKIIKPISDRVTRSSTKLLSEKIQEAAGFKPKSQDAKNNDVLQTNITFSLDKRNNNKSSNNAKHGTLQISSWNIAGLRSWMNKNGLKFLKNENPDIFCMQEIKRNPDQIPEKVENVQGYYSYWLSLPSDHAGVALYTKIKPIHVKYGIGAAEFDIAGRLITAEYKNFYLINVYVPNSGQNLVNLAARMRWDKLFRLYVKKLDARKPVIICGDMNVAHQEIDLANPKSNTRTAGFTIEERKNMTELLAQGFVDTFRLLYPDKLGAYTFWTYRANARKRNIGWRLDYFIVSKRISNRVIDSAIQSKIQGSDHCPITMWIKISI